MDHARKPSWKDRLTSVSKKLGVGSSTASPGKQSSSEREWEIGKREREEEGEKRSEWEVALDEEEWCVLTVNGSDLSVAARSIRTRAVAVVGDSDERIFEEVDGNVFNTEDDNMEREQVDVGLLERFRSSKNKSDKVDGGKNVAINHMPSPGIGTRKSSFGSRLKPDSSKVTRPGSPQPLQRRSSGRGRPKLDVTEHHHANGQASPRSTSPNRASASSRRKTSSSNPPSRTESPNMMERRHESPHSSLLVKQGPQNGKSGRASPAGSPSATSESAFSKVRDTLRISKAKKKLKKKKGTAYSVDPVEINFPATKYQDPFEAQPSFTDSLDVTPKAQSHDFKPVSIPHNKPEYCDHCGETAWGLYRQVLKCSSEFGVHDCSLHVHTYMYLYSIFNDVDNGSLFYKYLCICV